MYSMITPCYKSSSWSGFPNLPVTMHPFSISTDEKVPLKLLTTKRLNKMAKLN